MQASNAMPKAGWLFCLDEEVYILILEVRAPISCFEDPLLIFAMAHIEVVVELCVEYVDRMAQEVYNLVMGSFRRMALKG
jgi:hypothetical protein